MKIILDAMGGDHAPLAPVDGAIQAAEKLGVEVVLTGQPDAIQSALTQLGYRVKGKRNKNAEISKRALEVLDKYLPAVGKEEVK